VERVLKDEATQIGATPVSQQQIERLFGVLVGGDRVGARQLVEEMLSGGTPPAELITEVYWPTYSMIEKMYRADQMTTLAHNMSTKLLRVLVDQTAMELESETSNGRSVLAFCGPTEADELGAQMAVDLLEANGFNVRFAGGGVAGDEILEEVQTTQPDVLLMFASAPSDLPEIRRMIDHISEIGAWKATQTVVGGGVFNRADGLAEEIGADLWASSPAELVEVMLDEPERRAEPDQRTVGRKRKRAA